MAMSHKYLQKSMGNILISVVILVFLFHLNQLSGKDLLIFGLFFETQNQPMLTHTDNKFHFAIDYPNNWEKSVKLNNTSAQQVNLEGISQGMYLYEIWEEGERKAGGMLQMK